MESDAHTVVDGASYQRGYVEGRDVILTCLYEALGEDVIKSALRTADCDSPVLQSSEHSVNLYQQPHAQAASSCQSDLPPKTIDRTYLSFKEFKHAKDVASTFVSRKQFPRLEQLRNIAVKAAQNDEVLPSPILERLWISTVREMVATVIPPDDGSRARVDTCADRLLAALPEEDRLRMQRILTDEEATISTDQEPTSKGLSTCDAEKLAYQLSYYSDLGLPRDAHQTDVERVLMTKIQAVDQIESDVTRLRLRRIYSTFMNTTSRASYDCKLHCFIQDLISGKACCQHPI